MKQTKETGKPAACILEHANRHRRNLLHEARVQIIPVGDFV